MSGSIITGFSAAGTAPGSGAGHTFAGVGAEAGADAGASPLGLFGALLGAVVPAEDAANLATGKTDAATALAAAVGFAAPEATGFAPALPATDATVPLPDAAIPPSEAVVPPPDAALLPETPTPSLDELATALSALDAALQSGEPIDPALQQKLDELLDAIAAFLGLSLPETADPLLAAAPPADSGADPLQALAAAKAALVGTTPATAASGPAAGGTAGPLPTAGIEPSPPSGPTAGANPSIEQLADKLAALGEKLQPASPELAAKLQLLAQKLASGGIDPQKLAALGIDGDAAQGDLDLVKVVEALLSAPPQVKPVPAPLPFSAAALALPDDIVLAPGERPVAPPANTPTKAPLDPPQEPEFEPPTPNREPGRQDVVEGRAPNRQGFGPAPAAVEQPATADAKPALPAVAAVAAAAAVTAGAKAVHAAYQAPLQQVNIPQVAFEIVRQFQAGNSRFQIRLDPPELGRIDVRMSMDRDGNVHARMTVERSETLDLMQRDQRALEKALAQAGLDGAKTNLEFSLRQNPSDRDQRGNGSDHSPFGENSTADAEEPAAAPVITQQYRGSATSSGVNLFV